MGTGSGTGTGFDRAFNRRTLLRGAVAASVLGVFGAAACSSAEDSDSAGNTTGATGEGASSLTLDNAAWSFDETNNVYYQIGQAYAATPEAADYETLGVYVPGAYFSGTDNGDGTWTCTVAASGKAGDYTAATAPVVLPVNTPGYSAQQPPSEYSYEDVSSYMEAGLVYVAAGIRGKDSNTDTYSGNAPWGVTDIKATLRYLRFNTDTIPGDKDAMFVFGHSGGGAQSAVTGSSGDSELYTPYLETIGAAMTDADGKPISDAVAGAMCWCPITSLDYANAAYEWNMGQFATTGTRAEGTWTAAYSEDLAEAFAEYVNELGLKDGSGTTLTLDKSDAGTFLSGPYSDHLIGEIETSLNNFLSDTTFPYTPSTTTMAGMDVGVSGGPGGDSSDSDEEETTYATVDDYITYLNSDQTWVDYDAGANTAKVTSLEGFVNSQKSPTKDVGALDAPDRSATENTVMGLNTEGLHYVEVSKEVMEANESTYSGLTDWSDDYAASGYTSDFAKTDTVGKDVQTRVDMYNPMYFLSDHYDGDGTSTVAPHWRIRTGIMQGDTASTVEMNLALALANKGIDDVDFATVWGLGHTMAERTGDATENFITWVRESVS